MQRFIAVASMADAVKDAALVCIRPLSLSRAHLGTLPRHKEGILQRGGEYYTP